MVYIDIVIIIDLLLNFIILITTGYLLNRRTHFKKIFLSSVIGTIDLIFIVLDISNYLLIIINILLSIIMVIISFNYKDILYMIKNIIYMYLSSIFYGGFIYLIHSYFFPKSNNYLIYLIILLVTIPIISYLYVKSIKNIKINHSKYYQVDIYLKDEIISVTGFLDTGNKLFDPYKHRPIILLNKKLLKKYYQIIYVPYNTINNHSLLECIIPDKIYIHELGYRTKLVIGLINESNIEGVECILNEKLL